MSTTTGPVCHVAPVTPRTQPSPVALPSVAPVINPTPQNLQQAVNQLIQIIQLIGGQQRGAAGSFGSKQAPPQKPKPNRWQEFHRVEEQVTVKDPNSEATITFNRLNQLVMHDQVTGESWTWDRERR